MIDLQVQQQFGMIGLDITSYKYDLSIQHPNLSVQQKSAEITLEQPAATLNIDLTPARESLGYCGIATQQKIFNEDAMRTSMNGILRRAREGDELKDISKKINVATIVTEKFKPHQKDLELVNIEPLQIKVTQNQVAWDAKIGGVSTQFQQGKINGEFEYGSVKSKIEINPYIQFHAIGTVFESKR